MSRRTISIVGVLVVVVVVCFGIYSLAKLLVLHGYSSGEIVLENIPEETPLPIYEDRVVADEDRVADVPDMVYPSYVYNVEGVVLRCKGYLGSEYSKYEGMFEGIVSRGDVPFEGLDDSAEYLITSERNEKGISLLEGLWGNDIKELDACDVCDLSLDEGGFTIGASAVYFYDGVRVVYKLDTLEPSFYVVDYSNNAVLNSTDFADFGGVFGSSLYLIPELCRREVIEGYTVYFSYNKYVVKEW